MSDTGAVERVRQAIQDEMKRTGPWASNAVARAALAAAMPSVEDVRRAVGEVLWNASNYPEAVQARMLAQDTGPLRDKATAAFHGSTCRWGGPQTAACWHVSACGCAVAPLSPPGDSEPPTGFWWRLALAVMQAPVKIVMRRHR